MAIDIIQLPVDGSGKRIAARSYTESALTVYAQAGYLTTDTAGGNPVAVQNSTPAGTEYGLVTRIAGPVPTGTNTIGNVNVLGTQAGVTTTNWTSATALNTTAAIAVTGYNTVTIAMHNTSTMTGGVLTFEVSPDNVNWFPIAVSRIDSFTVENSYTLSSVADRAWCTSVDGFTNFRVRLSTVITGTGTATIFLTAQAFAIEPAITVGQSVAGSLNATVTQQPITKGTQGTTGITTQDLIDAGRSIRTLTIDTYPIAATAETLVNTLASSVDNAALSTGLTSYSVTAGKRFRVQSLVATLSTITGNTTAVGIILRVRANASGAAVLASPLQLIVGLNGSAAANQSANPVPISFPDGWEFAASTGIGFTAACPGFVTTTAAPKLSVTMTGFEY